ncbi:reverse transcriptase domain-containing protein [Tanacetum coccineum]
MADNRTMEELLQAPTEGYEEAIVIPEINADHFEIKTKLLQLVQANPFHGFERENPHTHINNFKRITSTLKFRDVPNDVIKLMMFPYSLEGAARVWYDKEPPNSILTWDDLTFIEAWERFKEMLRACPYHGFTELTQIDTFYNGLNENDQDSINAAAGGNLLSKTTREALNIIENKSKVRYSRSKSNVSRVNTTSRESSSKTDERIDKLADQISNLVKIVNKKVVTPATVKAVEESCVICGGAHAYYDCIATDSNQSSVCAETGTYNQVAPPNRASNQMAPPGFGPLQNNQNRKYHSHLPPVIPIPISEPDVPKTLPKPNIPYPFRFNDQKLREKVTNQIEKFFQIFQDLHFDISFADALILMPKFASTIKSLLRNKIPLNESFSVMLLKKLPEKLGDPDKFLIPCDFSGMDVCHALADLGASINLMPLSIWKKLSLPELTPTRMTLELADRSITRPKGVAEDVFVKVGKFHFPTDFVVVDFDSDPRVPIIVGRSFLRTGHDLIDVYGEEITLRVNDEAVTFNLNQTTRYSSTYDDMSVNRIDVIDIAYEEYAHEVLGFSNNSTGGNHTLTSEPIISDSSLSLTPFEGIEVTKAKSSIEEPPELELKDLPSHLEYAYLEGTDKLPVIIAKSLKDDEKEALLKVLKSYKRAIAWKITAIKGINHRFCTHKILMEEDYKPAIQSQRRVNPKIDEVIKKEVIKLLDAGMIYLIFDSSWMIFGVFQIPIDPQDQEKTTFTCPYGTFAYRRMPFGLCNAPGTFQRCMMAIFHDMIEKTMEVFMDDFSVFGDSFASCLSNLDKMLKRCEDTNLVLNWEKCHFMCKEGIVLGHKISKSGIEVDRAKVDVIAKLPHPTTVKGGIDFMGPFPSSRGNKYILPSLISFETSDSLLEEFADELALLDPFPPGNKDVDFEADLREIELLLNRDPSTDFSPKITIDPNPERFINEPALVCLPPPGDDDDDKGCDLPFCDNKMIFSNPLFGFNDDFTSSDDKSFLEEDVQEENFQVYSNPLFEFDDNYNSSDINPLFNKILEDIESEDSNISNFDEDECFDPGGDIDKIDAFLAISTDIVEGYNVSEGDVFYLESLLINNTTYNLSPEVFFDHKPKCLKDDSENLTSMIKVFDPGISALSSLEPVAFEFSMEVFSSTCFVPNVTMISGESS